MCRRFDPGPDHLLTTRVLPGNPGQNAGLFIFRPSLLRIGRRRTFLAIPGGSWTYRCAFCCAQRRAGRGHVQEAFRSLHVVLEAHRHAVADPLADHVLGIYQP